MTTPLERIESHPHESKRLIGIEYEHFLALVELAEKRHLEKQAFIEKNKIRIVAKGGGRRPDMSIKQGICLCLIYLRQKPIFEILGLLFDVSKTKANDTFNYWIEILREILPLRVRQSLQRGKPPQRAGSPASQIEEVSESQEKYQKLRHSLLEYELIVDSAEQPIERPVDYQEQKKYYSGKKKMHTLKNQFIVLPNGEDIVDVIVGKLGKTSDINLFRASRDKFDPKQKFLGDKAYKGDDAIATPHKKTKKTGITELQKQENKELSSRRIGVEHLIGRIKIFKVASDRFRLAHNKYNRVIMSVCGLVRLRMNQMFSLCLNS